MSRPYIAILVIFTRVSSLIPVIAVIVSRRSTIVVTIMIVVVTTTTWEVVITIVLIVLGSAMCMSFILVTIVALATAILSGLGGIQLCSNFPVLELEVIEKLRNLKLAGSLSLLVVTLYQDLACL